MVHAFARFLAAKAFGVPVPSRVDDDARDALNAMLVSKPGSLTFKAYYSLIVTTCSPHECRWGFPNYIGSTYGSSDDRTMSAYLHASRLIYDDAGTSQAGPGHTVAEHPYGTSSKLLYAAMCFGFSAEPPSSTELRPPQDIDDPEPIVWGGHSMPTYDEYRELELGFRAMQAKTIQRVWRASLHRKRVRAANVVKAAWKACAYDPTRTICRSRVLANFAAMGL